MKKIFLILLLSLINFYSVFASDIIDLNVSHDQIQIWEKIELEISINTGELETQEISVMLPGQDDFRVFSRQIENRIQNINGKVLSQAIYKLDLIPYSAGNYSLGPVNVSWEGFSIDDDSIIEIEVGNIISTTTQEKNILSRMEESAKEMDVKDISIPRVPFYWIIALLSVFFLSFYLLLSLFLKACEKSKKKQMKKDEKQKELTFEDQIHNYFRELGDRMDEISSQKFFRKYNKWIRKILKKDGISKALSATLSELKKDDIFVEHELNSIFKKSYKHEFSPEEKQKATRKRYIEKIISYLEK